MKRPLKLLRILALLLSVAVHSPILAEDSEEYVWVALRTHDRGLGQGISEYYGRLAKPHFELLTDARAHQAFIQLDHAASNYDGKYVAMSTEEEEGKSLGYSNTIYLRSDTISRIVVLSKDAVAALSELSKENGTQ